MSAKKFGTVGKRYIHMVATADKIRKNMLYSKM